MSTLVFHASHFCMLSYLRIQPEINGIGVEVIQFRDNARSVPILPWRYTIFVSSG